MSDFREYSELFHYGTKGMKWHNHKYRDDDDNPLVKFFGGQEEVNRLIEKGNTLSELADEGDYDQLLDYFVNDKEARAMMRPYINNMIGDTVKEKFGEDGYKKYKSMIKKLKPKNEKTDLSPATKLTIKAYKTVKNLKKK